MGRRTSGGQIGLEKIGLVQADENTLTTTQSDSDLVISPNGSGVLNIDTDLIILDHGDLKFREASSNGTNFIAMQAAAAMSANYTLTWPSSVASSNGYVLSSDTSGNLTWVAQTTAGITVSDAGSSGTTHYMYFGTTTSGQTTAFNYKSTVTFVPSTGELYSDVGRHPNIVGSNSGSGTLTIRGTSSGTKASASVLLTDGVASSSKTTGTLVVTGGVGVSGAVYTDTLNVASTSTFSGVATHSAELVVGSGNSIRAKYDNANNNYSSSLSWNYLQLGNNGDNVIVGGATSTGGNLKFYVNQTNIGSGGSISLNGSLALTLASNTNATFAGTITENSSIVYKENVNPITDALDKILKLCGVTYDRKNGSMVNEAGLIAEDVYEILPNLVQLNEEGKPHGIMYTKLTAYLIESIKTLKSEIDSLKK